MARPTKQGIDYFPLDCQFDDKIEMYLIEKEANGLAVLISVWQIIYSNEGYYTNNGEDLFLLVKKRVNVDINEIKDCINVCLKRDIFNKKLHQKYGILTSKAIQKRFFDAAKRKKEVQYDVNYIINGVNVSENAINVLHQSPNVNVKGDVKENVNVKIPFDEFWELYDKKVDKKKAEKAWDKFPVETQIKILQHVHLYKQAQPNKQYRKNPTTYFNNESWNDEIIKGKKDGIYEKHITEDKLRTIANDIANEFRE